jgi:hypothetical protein
MSLPQSPPICPTCKGGISDTEGFDYFVSDGGAASGADDVSSRYEEVSRLVRFLGALAQAAPLAVAQASEGSTSSEWVVNLSWLAQELAEETERRLLLLEDAGQIWERRAERSPAGKEGWVMYKDNYTYVPTSHTDPRTLVQYYDNLTLLLCHVKSLFELINLGMEGREDSASITAALGEHLCDEVGKRADALYQFAARKEGWAMATSKKVIPLTSPQKPQAARALPEFCTHVACPHEKPHSATDLRDNVDHLITHIMALFEAMTLPEVDAAPLAWIGVDLSAELAHRVNMLDHAHEYFK